MAVVDEPIEDGIGERGFVDVGVPLVEGKLNLPNTISGPSSNSSQFFYGPDRSRWKQVASYAGTSEQTIYIGGLVEKVALGGATHWKHYIAGGTGIVAEHIRHSTGTNETVYLLKDHLGSTEMITNSSGGQMSRLAFDAWGRRRSGGTWTGNPTAGEWTTITNTTRHGFTSHEMLDNLNLTHMNGRVYDQVLGRFLSADPFIDGVGNTQGWNRYAYVHNNPLRFINPSGFGAADKEGDKLQCNPKCPSDMGGSGTGGTIAEVVVAGRHEPLQPLLMEIIFRSATFDGVTLEPGMSDWGGTVGGTANGTAGAEPQGGQNDNGKCWNGEEGDWTDLVDGLIRQVGNDLSELGALLAASQNPVGAALGAYDGAGDTFGSNNTNLGILGSDLALPAEIVGTGGVGGVVRYAGLSGGTQGARQFLGLVGNRSIQMDHVFIQRGASGNSYWNLFPTNAGVNRLMGQANNYTLSNGAILRGALERFMQNGKLGAAAGGSLAAGDAVGRAIAVSGDCD